MINFWAPGCAACVTELPPLKEVYESHHKRGLEIIGVSIGDEAKDVLRFAKERKIPWPVCIGGGWTDKVAADCGIHAVPNCWLVDKRGILRETWGEAECAEKVEVLLSEP